MRWLIVLIISFVTMLSCNVYAETTIDIFPNYDFYGREINKIVTNGERYVKMAGNKHIFVSGDFKLWLRSYTFENDFNTRPLFCIDDKFIILNTQENIVSISTDGISWSDSPIDINIDSFTDFSEYAQNSEGILILATGQVKKENPAPNEPAYEGGVKHAIYFSKDGVSFKEITCYPTNIPYSDNLHFRVVNDKFVVEIRDDAVDDDTIIEIIYEDTDKDALKNTMYTVNTTDSTLEKLDVKGSFLTFYDNAYHAIDYSGDTYKYYKSTDLKNWGKNEVTKKEVYPADSIIVKVDGIETAFTSDGQLLKYINNKWENIESPIRDVYLKSDKLYAKEINMIETAYPIEYELFDGGMISWTKKNIALTKDFVNFQKQHIPRFSIDNLYSDGEYFYILEEDGQSYKSMTGWSDWTECDYDENIKNIKSYSSKGSNGELTLETRDEYRDSYSTKAVVTDKAGNQSIVRYEGNSPLKIVEGNGFFLFIYNNKIYCSSDGINKYSFGDSLNNIIKADNIYMMYPDRASIVYITIDDEFKNFVESVDIDKKIKFKGEYLSLDYEAFDIDGKTMMPLEFILKYNKDIEGIWKNYNKREFSLKRGDILIKASVDSELIEINENEKVKLSLPFLNEYDGGLFGSPEIFKYLGFEVKESADCIEIY